MSSGGASTVPVRAAPEGGWLAIKGRSSPCLGPRLLSFSPAPHWMMTPIRQNIPRALILLFAQYPLTCIQAVSMVNANATNRHSDRRL